MEEYVSCYHAIAEIIAKASQQFGNAYTLDQEKASQLKELCDTIDSLAEEFEYTQMDASVTITDKTLTISFVCDEIVLEDGQNHLFFSLITMLDSFSFAKASTGGLWVDLNIKGLWVKRDE